MDASTRVAGGGGVGDHNAFMGVKNQTVASTHIARSAGLTIDIVEKKNVEKKSGPKT